MHPLRLLQGQLKEAKARSNVRPQVPQGHALHCEFWSFKSQGLLKVIASDAKDYATEVKEKAAVLGKLLGSFQAVSRP